MKIKYFLATQLFIGLLLSGCNPGGELANPENPSSSSSSTVSDKKQFDATNFPLESCSDSLPEDPQAYPIELYTVFINGNEERDFKLIQAKYCQQVLGFLSPDFGMQLATFTSREKAEQFKEIISQYFENVQISEPEIIRELSENPSSRTDNLETPEKFETTEEIAKAALLSEAQMQELLAIDRSEVSLLVSSKPDTLKVVVPTYIPQGFELTRFDVRQQGDYGNSYDIWYKNPMNNQCFSFQGFHVLVEGGGAGLSAVVNANSRALGLTPIAYTSSVKMGDRVSSIGFYGEQHNKDFGDFMFNSPSYGYDEEPCEAMSFVEAVKVAESFEFLQPLNPRQKTDTQLTNNPFQSMSFPKESCGDSLPEDPDAYPVEFYPVLIDYSESNLESVQSQFCRDSLKIYRESLDKEYIQVSSFIGRERANQFK
ncbi:MAG: hypothetical protein RID53_23860, partial [Coleofasciculus sp. B1-GNL1-01]